MVVATVEATDYNHDELTYTLGGTDGESFYILDENIGELRVRSTTQLDYETRRTYEVTVTADDEQNTSDTVTLTIEVTDVEHEGTVILPLTQPRVGKPGPGQSVRPRRWRHRHDLEMGALRRRRHRLGGHRRGPVGVVYARHGRFRQVSAGHGHLHQHPRTGQDRTERDVRRRRHRAQQQPGVSFSVAGPPCGRTHRGGPVHRLTGRGRRRRWRSLAVRTVGHGCGPVRHQQFNGTVADQGRPRLRGGQRVRSRRLGQ